MEENPNIVWAQIFVDGLAQAGLTAVVIAPGSRSTPLTLAFDAHPSIAVFVHLDERSAGFYALGMAVALDRPVALVCTSGTAVANFLPAIVEARMSQIPLLALTADRPHELRHSGANQTIDQVKIYGDQVLWSVDAPVPQPDAPAVVLRHVHTLALRAYAAANGLPKGPVQVNFPFRAPLEPRGSEQLAVSSEQLAVSSEQLAVSSEQKGLRIPDHASRITHHASRITHHASPITRGLITLPDAQLDFLADIIQLHPRGLIVCGPRCPGGAFPAAVAALARQAGYPILADPISGARFGEWVADTAVLSAYETYLQTTPPWPEPQVILRFGAVPTSKWLNAYLDKIAPAYRLHIRENGVWADDGHRTTHFIQANETAVCQQLINRLPERDNGEWLTAVTTTENRARQALETNLYDPYFDGAVVADVVDLLPPRATLFMGNSSPIRHLDQYGRAQSKPLFAYANRGASGIDGNISTALGIQAMRPQPLVAVLGDITFYHDLNGLLLVAGGRWQVAGGKWQVASGESQVDGINLQPATCNLPLTIVLLHNDGGGIFNRLPIANVEPPFTKLFLTPHGLDFEPVVRMFGLEFARADGRAHFRQLLSDSLGDGRARVIEVRSHNQTDDQRRRQLNNTVIQSL
ncbi:MAG: 2-succinyl-5-enolpyruvyl-6-hydroxy-3-cyclohexene- 1-carboxylate synthase [Chloroflexota bacterium]|nr:2-succinyl-5-enolpyruvyl-6-hydroxy-3-cyclohexene-1-carboxylic-acid synthase [Ardenticatenaceae bacterium]GIK57468.1 MAG: 2-succinyl-5-enolpyruvyl-6-hydroxy-3-cyclohexene- 1-carboxylate synthase [Chloroflexota bacterium]